MRKLLHVLLVVPVFASGQYYFEDFDGTSFSPILYVIDTAAGNLWQVGPPQKGLFNAAHSSPNVIVTDTLATYPTGNSSSFTLKAPLWSFWGWNVFFLRFYHALDTDTLMDGGFLEVSWDNGLTWTNIYDDWMMPLNIENFYESTWQPFMADTLPNGQMGYSGRTGGVTSGLEWVYSSFCWEPIGFPLGDSLFVRYTFVSDSLSEYRDGWMIDDITLEAYTAHPVNEYTRMDDYFSVTPTLVEDLVMIVYDLDREQNQVQLTLHDGQGRLVKRLRDGQRPRGVEHILLTREDLPSTSGPMYIKGRINGVDHLRRIVLAVGH